MTEFSLTSPCTHCPFRTDIKPFLLPIRIKQLERDLTIKSGVFYCHKTLKKDPVACAGALILAMKCQRLPQLARIAMRLGMFDPDKLDAKAPVFDSFDDMHEAAKRSEV